MPSQLNPPCDHFGHGVWRELLLALLGEAEDLVGAASAGAAWYFAAKPLYELAKRAASHLAASVMWHSPSLRARAEALV